MNLDYTYRSIGGPRPHLRRFSFTEPDLVWPANHRWPEVFSELLFSSPIGVIFSTQLTLSGISVAGTIECRAVLSPAVTVDGISVAGTIECRAVLSPAVTVDGIIVAGAIECRAIFLTPLLDPWGENWGPGWLVGQRGVVVNRSTVQTPFIWSYVPAMSPQVTIAGPTTGEPSLGVSFIVTPFVGSLGLAGAIVGPGAIKTPPVTLGLVVRFVGRPDARLRANRERHGLRGLRYTRLRGKRGDRLKSWNSRRVRGGIA